uniref:tRNA-specific adenosine deaminase 1 n=1 Tax=Megaselia scalaris TaxID=36166 RepID=T1GLJ6_MEGSC
MTHPSEICEIAIKKFENLPKTGKPTQDEWTILAAVILYDKSANSLKVVSLGTGTKSLPKTKYCKNGLILNDSHAEVIAKRAFQKYLFSELRKDDGIFTFNQETVQFEVKEDLSFHFYTSHVPCGDACIIPEKDESYSEEPVIRQNAQDIGAVRLKPGKGIRTLSMSCSDKLAKWNVLGVQGSLLSSLISKPIILESINLSCDFEHEAIERAIWKRFNSQEFDVSHPLIRKGFELEIDFEFCFDKDKNPCPNTIAWADVQERPLQVSVNGKRLGVGKKQFYNKKSSLDICKRLLFENYLDFVGSNHLFLKKFGLTRDELFAMKYEDVKNLSKSYQKTWKDLKIKYFKMWVEKDFCFKEFSSIYENKP